MSEREIDSIDAESWLLRLLIIVVLGIVLATTHQMESPQGLVTVSKIVGVVSKTNRIQVSIEVRNNENKPQEVKVAWYLSYPGDTTPWATGLFSSAWQESTLAAKSIAHFDSIDNVSLPKGTYQLVAFVHGFSGKHEMQVGEAISRGYIQISKRSNFYRNVSSGPAFVSAIQLPTAPRNLGPFLNVRAKVKVVYPASLSQPVSVSWDLIDAKTLASNSWESAPTLLPGLSYPFSGSSSSISIDTKMLGIPGQKYLLRLKVFVGEELSDTVIVPVEEFIGGATSSALNRIYFPPVTDPLIVTGVSFPPTWQSPTNPIVSVKVSNTANIPESGQLILQVGKVGDPSPWKDPSYTFPLTTFTVPANSTVLIPDIGNPAMAPGDYELGIYVHDSIKNGQFAPGDQVLAKQNIVFNSPSVS